MTFIFSILTSTTGYIKTEGQSGRMSARLLGVVAKGHRGRVYLSPRADFEATAREAESNPLVDLARETFLAGSIPEKLTGGTCYKYGLTSWGSLFTSRQLVALTNFCDLVTEARDRAKADAIAAGLVNDNVGIDDGGIGAQAYTEAVATYLAFGVDKAADYWSSITSWHSGREIIRNTMARQAIPMVWDFTEVNPFSSSTGNFLNGIDWGAKVLDLVVGDYPGEAKQLDATQSMDGIQNPVLDRNSQM
ncbi:hypothetical protein ES708_09092 [subsurface metagenome]